MADVKVEMKPGWEQVVSTMPSVMDALDDKAGDICGKANSMAAGFRTKRWMGKGGTQAVYGSKEAEARGRTSVALVYTANYAAQKENMQHNTLLKSI